MNSNIFAIHLTSHCGNKELNGDDFKAHYRII